jgi:glucosyl-3-phosphoglycerate synthase
VRVKALDPERGERRGDIGVELVGHRHEPRLPGTFARFAHETPVLAGGVEQRAPRLGSAVEGQGLEIVEAMSPTAAERWAQARSFHHSLYPPARIAAERTQSISVCLPARECAQTIAPIVEALLALRAAGALDEVAVVDAASADGTAEVAPRAGATVWQEAELMPAQGAVLGKGDAMWRALSVLQGELVCFLDADTEAFSAHFASGVIGALVCEPGVAFVKGHYRRPIAGGQAESADGGGRVNHLMARPALALFYPELAAVRQPLAGEVAARRELLESLPVANG